MDILTLFGLDYRVASLIQLYFVVPGINKTDGPTDTNYRKALLLKRTKKT